MIKSESDIKQKGQSKNVKNIFSSNFKADVSEKDLLPKNKNLKNIDYRQYNQLRTKKCINIRKGKMGEN